MNAETRDERLRRLLRDSDPAGGETGLTTEEVQPIRRKVLTAAPETRRHWLQSPALAGAALAALILAVAWAMWPSRPDMNVRATAGVPSGTQQALVVPPGTTAGSPAASAPGGEGVVAEKSAAPPPGENRPRRIRKPTRAPTSPEPDQVAAQVEERQIQFSTPGGTRVIWILTSEKAL
jgi:hypothetical protein